MKISSDSLTNVGGREYNGDCLGHWSTERFYHCVVADGVGRHGGGDIASHIVVETVLMDLRCLTDTQRPVTGERLARSLLLANAEIQEEQGRGDVKRKQMRSTAAVLSIDREHGTAAWAHCGDTRLYCVRDHMIVAQTRDHSLVQAMVEAGTLADSAVRQHPHRSMLLSALGTVECELQISHFDGALLLQEGDVFLLCTDGLWEWIDESAMLALLYDSASPNEWLFKLAGQVRKRAKWGNDNFSAYAVRIGALTELPLKFRLP
ncbi:hypothetical protein WL13_27345 [Burkholderia ubonensis]|uniref:PP2C family protein-serine/threonine phosphatase n=1 Tax=Burkholderia ubonensis TaxID=101571 RepID=UPI00075F1880|nr:protein phosphatase 2C domain-containing protein [Burkholderia ubonensis]KVZ32077.1 hypothetical protein WL13_27345 [Burkholderia ubonensis]KWB18553.1 hypothetical protein WL33_06625 [Burkholderia ubonensis]